MASPRRTTGTLTATGAGDWIRREGIGGRLRSARSLGRQSNRQGRAGQKSQSDPGIRAPSRAFGIFLGPNPLQETSSPTFRLPPDGTTFTETTTTTAYYSLVRGASGRWSPDLVTTSGVRHHELPHAAWDTRR